MRTFLDSEDIAILTGRKMRSLQILALQKMGLPFWVNALGKPVVAVAAVEGRREAPQKKTWTPPE